jgi:MinD-like ATPase involved in chromosome partitioning or flagellar assembly
MDALPDRDAPAAAEPVVEPGTGRLVAVWGPTGAPGRTTVAVGVATELASAGTPTLLADADVYGGVVAQVLGFLDEAPGLAAAARLANNGQLDVAALAGVAVVASRDLRVLTGISRADRWPELRPAALEQVWELARSLAAVTVVDVGFCLEQDEELSFDTAAPRRNGATVATLLAANVVLAVGSADPVGMQRRVRGVTGLREAAPGVLPRVVVNRVRRSAVGADPEAQLAEALERYAGVRDVAFVPDDREAMDVSLLQARALCEVSPDSPARRALAGIAAGLVGRPAPRRKRGLLRR